MKSPPWKSIPETARLKVRDLPRRQWGFILKGWKTIEVLALKLLQILNLYRPQKSIVGIPTLASHGFTRIQAVVYNGTQEELLGYKQRAPLHRLLKGLPDVELFERVRFQLVLSDKMSFSCEGNTRSRGFTQIEIHPPIPSPPPEIAWLRIQPAGVDTYLGRVPLGEYEISSPPVFFLTPKTKWVVVSDIDDTIKDSRIAETTSFRMVISSIFRGHYYTYEPIEGMPQLYQELASKGGVICYLTSTPIQLAPFLLRFLKQAKFPDGPIFPRWLGYGKVRHKLQTLNKIFSALEPGQKVLLLGDSGERDVEIYRRIRQHPERDKWIEKVFIRHVPGTPLPKPNSPKEVIFSDISELTSEFRALTDE